MLGTMYGNHSLPRAYGGSYGRQKSSSGGVLPTLVILVLLVLCGGLGFSLIANRAHMKQMADRLDKLQDELTYNKNHMHHLEAQVASRETDNQHLEYELKAYRAGGHPHELVDLRAQKRQLDVNLAVASEQNTKLRQDLETSNSLVEAYKQHLSDEVAAHHQREETWMHIQEEWEKLEKQMEEEINSLKNQLHEAKIQIAETMVRDHKLPQHVQAEAAHPHDKIWDSLPPPGHPHQVPSPQVKTPAQVQNEQLLAHHHQQQQQQQQQQQPPSPQPQPVHQDATHHHQQQQQQQQQQPSAHPEHAAPVPVHDMPAQQQQQQGQVGHPEPATPQHQPPQPVEAHHDDHHDWQQDWQNNDYDKYFDPHNHYADYPGWVDDHHQQQQQQHHESHHDAHGQAHDSNHGHQDQHQQQHHQQQHQQPPADSHHGHHDDWHHQDDSHHFQHHDHQHSGWHPSTGASQEVYNAHHDDWAGHDGNYHWHEHHQGQMMHVDQAEREWLLRQQQEQHQLQLQHPHAAAAQATQQQNAQAVHPHQLHHQQQMQQAAQHHVHNDLSLKLGLGGAMAQHSSWH